MLIKLAREINEDSLLPASLHIKVGSWQNRLKGEPMKMGTKMLRGLG